MPRGRDRIFGRVAHPPRVVTSMSTRTLTRLADTLPDLMPDQFPRQFPGHGENAPLDLPALDPGMTREIGELFSSPEFDAWSESLAKVENVCARSGCSGPRRPSTWPPGRSVVVLEPAGAAGGHPGAVRKPTRARVPVLLAGLRRRHVPPDPGRRRGGKSVPETVVENPLVFATLTAPSFGHGARHRADGRRCRPRARAGRCRHGGR